VKFFFWEKFRKLWDKKNYLMECRFKKGDKVVCIRMNDRISWEYTTTRLCIYEVIEIESWKFSRLYDEKFGIINDRGVQIVPTWKDYLSIKEYRKLKLEKINGYDEHNSDL
jgi:hypothetical protein